MGGELFTFTFISLFGENISPRYSNFGSQQKIKGKYFYSTGFPMHNCGLDKSKLIKIRGNINKQEQDIFSMPLFTFYHKIN
jgi:hypothetical protein